MTNYDVNLTLASETELTAALVKSTLENLDDWSSIVSGDTIDITIESTKLTTIKTNAFTTVSHKDKITLITIPDSVLSIEANAFEGCDALTSITFNDYEKSNLADIVTHAFAGLTKLVDFVIPDNVASIEAHAFTGCSALEIIDFNNYGTSGSKLSTIVTDTFAGLTALEDFVIPDNVASIEAHAFRGCSALEVIGFYNYGIYANTDGTILGSQLSTIVTDTFKDLTALTTFGIPDNVSSIQANAFSGCSALEVIGFYNYGIYANTDGTILGSQLSTIVTDTFKDLTALTTFGIPDNVSSIQANAFSGCSALEIIGFYNYGIYAEPGGSGVGGDADRTIPGSQLSTIVTDTFKDLTALNTFAIPDNVSSIEANAFSGCLDLEDIYFYNYGIYANTDGTILGSQLSIIVTDTFKDLTKLVDFKIPDNVSSIEANAFRGCSALKTIDFYNYGIYANTDGTIPGSQLSTIVTDTFAGLTALEDFVIPDNVASIEAHAFRGCSALEVIGFYNYGIYALDDAGELTDLSGSQLSTIVTDTFAGLLISEFIIPDNVSSIEANAFSGCSALEDIEVNDPEKSKLTSIAEHAFAGLLISEFIIPDNVSSIEANAFSGCSALEVIGFYNYGTSGSKLSTIVTDTFAGLTALEDFVIPDNVASIEAHAFRGCSALRDIYFYNYGIYALDYAGKLTDLSGSQLSIIVTDTFKDLTKLVDFKIPDNVSSIEANAFRGCSALKTIDFNNYGTSGSKLSTIVTDTFAGLTALEDFKIPDNVASIEAHAFRGCSALEVIGFYNYGIYANTDGTILGSQLSTIVTDTFKDLTALTTFGIPDNVSSIQANAFSGCSALEVIGFNNYGVYANTDGTIPGSKLSTIVTDTFKGLTELVDFKIPDNVSSIEANAFSGCSALKTIDFNNYGVYANTDGTIPGSKLSTIVTDTFKGLTALEDFAIPDNVSSIEANAFSGCLDLEDIYFYNYGIYANTDGTIPGSQLSTIVTDTFAGLTALNTFAIPDNVASIEANAFSGCLDLEDIYFYNYGIYANTDGTIPGSQLSTIVTDTFAGLTALEDFAIPDNVASIEANAFSGCSALRDIYFYNYGIYANTDGTIPGSQLSTIVTDTFKDLTALTTFAIPDNVSSIEANAFSGCSALEIIGFYNYGIYAEPGGTNGGGGGDADRMIPGSQLSTIVTDTFKDLTALTTFGIPDNVSSIEANAFSGCSALRDLDFYSFIKAGSKLTTITEGAFANLPLSGTFRIPANVTSIGAGAFEGCTSLTRIDATRCNFEDMTKLHLTHFEKERYLFHGRTKVTADTDRDAKDEMADDIWKKYFWFPVLTNSNVSEIDIYTGAVVNEILNEITSMLPGDESMPHSAIVNLPDILDETHEAARSDMINHSINVKWNQVEISWCLCGPGMDLTFIGNRGHSAFKGRDLTGCNIEGVNFSNCDLTGTKF